MSKADFISVQVALLVFMLLPVICINLAMIFLEYKGGAIH